MKISELVKILLENQKNHGDVTVFAADREVRGATFYKDEDEEPFIYLES